MECNPRAILQQVQDSAVLLYYFGAPVNKTGTNQKEKGGREPAACPKKRVPIVEKREDDGVSTMHGAVANTFF